jgi:hypothetical protein
MMGFFLYATAVSKPALRPTWPPVQWIPAAVTVGIKRPGHEPDHFHFPTYETELINVVVR